MGTGTLLRMRQGRHSRIPGLGFIGPGEVFECPAQLNYGSNLATAKDLIDSGLAEPVETMKIRRPTVQRRAPREEG